MADSILINMYISKLGLTGNEAEEKRKELAKLSDDELSMLMSGKKTALRTDIRGLNGLRGTQSYNGETFFNYKPNNNEPVFDVPKPKTYNAREEKELRNFAAEYLYDSAEKAVKMQKEYHSSIGVISTDAVVQGSINIGDWIWDSITGRDDYHTLTEQQKYLEKEFNSAEKLKKSVDRKGMFEFNFERERKIPYNNEAVENLKNKSEEYTKITAYSEKYAQFENGLNEVKSVIRQEEEYKNALKFTRGSAAASITPPKVSSHEKFGQVLLEYCNGNQELVAKYMSELQTKMGSRQEIEKNYIKILDELKNKCKAEYEKQLGGKTYEQHTLEYNNAYKKAFGGENVENMTKSYIEAQKTTSAYAEIGLTIAVSLLLPGSSVVSKGGAKLAASVGEKAAGQILKGTMTMGMASMPAAITTIGTATSEAGFTDEKKAEILEKWKSGMLYGGLGAYVSGPLGNAVENILKTKPTVFTNIVGKAFNNSSKAVSTAAKTAGVTAETGADVVLDLLTNDMDVKASLEQNGVMNVGMMIAGGRLSKMHKSVEGMKVEKASDNTFNIKDAEGKLVFKAQDENVMATYLISRAADNLPENLAVKNTENNQNTKSAKKQKEVQEFKDAVSKIIHEEDIPVLAGKNIQSIKDNAKLNESKVLDFLSAYGLGTDGVNMSHRLKSERSITDKITRLVVKENKSIDTAAKGVFDSIGARTEAEKFDYKKHSELVELYKRDPEAAVKRAAEMQSQPVVDKIKKIMLDYKNGKSDVKIKTVSNYMGENGLPYFSEKQMDDLFDFAAKNKIEGFTINEIKKTKTRDSGYTALQMNFETKDGFVFEWQYRGEEVNRFAEAEHVPYDIRQGKDVTGGDKRLEPLYAKVKNASEKLNADGETYKQYLKDHYMYLRKKELGFDVQAPKLPEQFDKSISAENLEKLADLAYDVKHNKISTKDALSQYNFILHEKDVTIITKELAAQAKANEKKAIDFIEMYGLGTDGKNMTHRLKTDYSISERIIRSLSNGKDINAASEIYDTFGARTIADNVNYKTMPEYEKGNNEAALRQAMEIQSKDVIEKLKKIITDNKNGVSDIKINKIANMGNGIPYFSKTQIEELIQFAKENDIEISLPRNLPVMWRPSGYTALQVSFETKDGFVFEWQYRGKEIDRFAEAEHIRYDFHVNKDMTEGREDLKKLYQRVKEVFNKEDFDLNDYNAYTQEYYDYLHFKELGYDSKAPKLPEQFDKSISAENLEKLADIAGALKEGKITEAEALKSYDEYLNAKQPATEPVMSYEERLQNFRQMLSANKDFSKEEISRILGNTNEQNISFVEKLCLDKDFPERQLFRILRKTKESNIVLAEKLCFDKDFPKEEIAYILGNTNEQNISFVEKLCLDKDFPKEEISRILGNTNEQNFSFVEKLCLDKDFPKEEISRILGITNEQNFSFVEKLCFDKDFPKEQISSIVGETRERNRVLSEKLCFDKDFPKENIWKILECTNERNISLAEKLCFDKDFPKEQIWKIVGETNEQNISLAEKLCFDKDFPKEQIWMIVGETNEQNISLAEKICFDKDFPKEKIWKIVSNTNKHNIGLAEKLCSNYKKMEVSFNDIVFLLSNADTVTYRDLQRLKHILGSAKMSQIPANDLVTACKFSTLAGKTNINEIPIQAKRKMLRDLVSSNEDLFRLSDEIAKEFPLLPKNQEEYCALLPSIVRSLGIETNTLKPGDVKQFNKSVEGLSNTLEKVSDSDFANLRITQEYTKDEFIKTVLHKVKDLTPEERQKVYDYFGFELHHNKNNQTGFSITGYPVNLNNGKKLAQITRPQTKAVVEALRPDVIKFSENNPIKCGNPEIEKLLNVIVKDLPELHAVIGKPQHETHDFDVMQHSLKVMQKVTQDPKFKTLNESDRKILLLSSLMHDITKSEGRVDKTHANESSFDTYFIAKKFNLTKAEELKLYTLTRHHEWLEYVNTAKSEAELTKRLQSVAYDLQYDNLADMAVMLSHADLKSVKADDSFHNTLEGNTRVGLDGVSRSYGKSADIYAERIDGYVKELQKSQPLLPVTKIPKAGSMKNAITTINADGTTNIKGVYVDNDGLVIIKYNEVEDWQALGFPEGTSSKGIMAKGVNNKGMECDIETGNIKFFAHGLNAPNQLTKFDAFSLVDSDALLSVSYTERPESKYRFFRTQGVLLDVATKYVHGGGNTDSGSGYGKNLQTFKDNYIFGGERESDRVYVSNLIKEATGMNDAEYVNFVKENSNKSMLEIEPAEVREKIIKAFATINSNVRNGNREYNEMYVSNPEVMAVFAYSKEDKIGNALEFFNKSKEDLDFLKTYALERDIPMVIFGD